MATGKKIAAALLFLFVLIFVFLTLHQYQSSQTNPYLLPSGSKKKFSTKILETGSAILQRNAPLKNTTIYLVAFHPMKADLSQQMEAHHYCKQVNEDFAQCVLFDGNTEQANLTGIEYIISEKLYQQLPDTEKTYWHPHNYEILSGQLMAPGLPVWIENKLMKKKINSYGKTWHTWMTGGSHMPEDKLPIGEAMLAWSINHDGEVNPTLLKDRDRKMDVNTEKRREDRIDLRKYAHPQGDDISKNP